MRSLSRDAEDYWPLATLAEALLISGRPDEAASVLAKARGAKGADDGAKATTLLQFRRLTDALGTDMAMLVKALGPRNVAVFSGHIFRGDELDQAAQEETEAAIRARAEEIFTAHNVGIVYGALAAGADIILAETALRLGAELDIVLPFATERFVESSVKIGDPPGQPGTWERRFRAILDGGQACARSPSWTRPTRPSAISTAISSMHSAMPPAARWRGRRCCRPTAGWSWCRTMPARTALPAPTACSPIGASMQGQLMSFAIRMPGQNARRATGGQARFRPVVFLWDAAQDGKDGKGLEKLLKSAGKGLKRVDRTHRDGRRGTCLIAGSTGGRWRLR